MSARFWKLVGLLVMVTCALTTSSLIGSLAFHLTH